MNILKSTNERQGIDASAHGTRRSYQRAGCRCVECRAANAAYMTSLRGRKARNAPIAGAYVSGVETRRQLRLLRAEYESDASLAARIGWKCRRLRIKSGAKVRLFTAHRIAALYDADILSGLAHVSTRVDSSRALPRTTAG